MHERVQQRRSYVHFSLPGLLACTDLVRNFAAVLKLDLCFWSKNINSDCTQCFGFRAFVLCTPQTKVHTKFQLPKYRGRETRMTRSENYYPTIRESPHQSSYSPRSQLGGGDAQIYMVDLTQILFVDCRKIGKKIMQIVERFKPLIIVDCRLETYLCCRFEEGILI